MVYCLQTPENDDNCITVVVIIASDVVHLLIR